MAAPQDEKEATNYLPDYIWEIANPCNFGASTAVDKMNDMLLAFDPNTPARGFGNHHLAMGIMEREQPSIHETIRRMMMVANADRYEDLHNIRKLPMSQWAENGYDADEYAELSMEFGK